MDPIHAVLIVLVLVLILTVSKDHLKALSKRSSGKAGGWLCTDKKTGDKLSVDVAVEPPKKLTVASTVEEKAKEAMRENAEYFQTCKDADETAKVLDCACDDSTGFAFAKNDYGAPGLDYNSYVMSQAVDNQVIKNHGEFIRDRKNVNSGGTEFTGSTGISQLSVPRAEAEGLGGSNNWVGLRRPMAVKVCNPTTVTQDEVTDGFRTKRYCI